MMICTTKPLTQNQSLLNQKSTAKKPKRLVARWKTVNGKLICQWIAE